jgi:hypothetical protein
MQETGSKTPVFFFNRVGYGPVWTMMPLTAGSCLARITGLSHYAWHELLLREVLGSQKK